MCCSSLCVWCVPCVQRVTSRTKQLALQLANFKAAGGVAAEHAIPGPIDNYTDMEKVVHCGEMQ